jgi:CheY-like chemotaxis protein
MPHVLVADDDEHIRFQVEQVLRQRGYSVETAYDGKDAFSRALAKPPDLLITDVMMPKLDGWSLVRELRTRLKLAELPVIFLTALSTEDDKIRAFRLGADDYVIKPFRLDDLAKRVASALSGRRKPAASEPPPTNMGLRGDLAQVGLSTLLVLVEMERKTGVLAVRSTGGESAQIMIRDGKCLAAEMRGASKLADAACIYQLLRWKTGDFAFSAKPIEAADRIQLTTTQLLMEGARLVDEESAPVRIPPPGAVKGGEPARRDTPVPDEDALAEWESDQRTPLVVAAKLAELVRKTARATLPPLNVPKVEPEPEPSIVVAPEPPKAAEPPRVAEPEPVPDPPRVARPAPKPEPPPPSRVGTEILPRAPTTWWLAAAIVIAGAGTAIPLLLPQSGAPADRDALPRLQADADKLAAAIDTATSAARLRVKNLATTPLLRAGIETDAATIQDFAKTEQLFVPVNGEVIEVFQLRDGTPVSMLRAPANAPALQPALEETTRLASDGHALSVIASAPIAKQSAGIGGVLAIATPCDLQSVTRSLAAHASRATLVGVDKPVVLVPSSGDSGTPVSIPLAKPLALEAVVAGAAATGETKLVYARFGLWGLAGVLGLIYISLLVRARRTPT